MWVDGWSVGGVRRARTPWLPTYPNTNTNKNKNKKKKVDDAGTTRLYCVPYSEHSSFAELQAYVRALKPRYVHRVVGLV